MRNWEYKLVNYKRALATLQRLRNLEVAKLSDLEVAGAIKQFEDTQELGWKVLHAFLYDSGAPDLMLASRPTIDAAFNAGLLLDYKVYYEMIDKRNQTAHIYNEAVANDILVNIVPKYLPALEHIAQTLEDERA